MLIKQEDMIGSPDSYPGTMGVFNCPAYISITFSLPVCLHGSLVMCSSVWLPGCVLVLCKLLNKSDWGTLLLLGDIIVTLMDNILFIFVFTRAHK